MRYVLICRNLTTQGVAVECDLIWIARASERLSGIYNHGDGVMFLPGLFVLLDAYVRLLEPKHQFGKMEQMDILNYEFSLVTFLIPG